MSKRDGAVFAVFGGILLTFPATVVFGGLFNYTYEDPEIMFFAIAWFIGSIGLGAYLHAQWEKGY